jgi:hypothetical protein
MGGEIKAGVKMNKKVNYGICAAKKGWSEVSNKC